MIIIIVLMILLELIIIIIIIIIIDDNYNNNNTRCRVISLTGSATCSPSRAVPNTLEWRARTRFSFSTELPTTPVAERTSAITGSGRAREKLLASSLPLAPRPHPAGRVETFTLT